MGGERAAAASAASERHLDRPKTLPLRLSSAEEERLAREALPWVREIARSVGSQMADQANIDDLASAGHEALVKIVRRYQSGRSPFEGYVRNRLRFAMLDVLRKERRHKRRATALIASMLTLVSDGPRGDHAEAMPPSEAQFRRRFMQSLSVHTVAMMFGLASEECAKAGLPSGPARLDPEQSTYRNRMRREVARALDALPDDRERTVIKRLYIDGHTLAAVAGELQLSRSWVSRLHSRAMRRLAAILRRDRAV